MGVRPAFKLNLKSVLFTSSAEGSKSPAVGGQSADEVGKSPAAEGGGEISLKNGDIPTIPAIGKYEQKDSQGNTIPGKDWKLTMLDNTRNNFTASAVKVGNVLTIDYKGAKVPGETEPQNEYISVILADEGDKGEFTHYLTAAQFGSDSYNSEKGTVKVQIPSDVDMSKKTLFVINEQQNGDYKTDFSSGLNAVKCEEIEIDGEMGTNGWYIEPVTIKAPQGWTISKEINGNFEDVIKYEEETTETTVKYYLKPKNGKESDVIGLQTTLKIDLYPPTVTCELVKDDVSATAAMPVSISEQSKPIVGKVGSKLKITAEDNYSGIKETKYFQTNSHVANTDSISGWKIFDRTETLEVSGNGYIYVYAEDEVGKSKTYECRILTENENEDENENESSAPESNPNGNPSSTIPDYIIPNESAATVTAAATTTATAAAPATAQTTAETAVQPVNTEPNLLFEDITEQPETTYSESTDVSNSDSEQTTTKETAVGNESNSDNPPKTGNIGGFVPIIGITVISLIGIGTATIYNKKRKR